MAKTRKKMTLYSDDIKKEAVELVQGGMTQSEAGKKLGLHHTLVSNWVRKAEGRLPSRIAKSRKTAKAKMKPKVSSHPMIVNRHPPQELREINQLQTKNAALMLSIGEMAQTLGDIVEERDALKTTLRVYLK